MINAIHGGTYVFKKKKNLEQKAKISCLITWGNYVADPKNLELYFVYFCPYKHCSG